MRLPEIADRLRLIAENYGDDEIRRLADQMRRRRPPRVAEPKSTPMTPDLAARIRDFVADNPRMSQLEVGRIFNVNPGRVSEAVRGKRQ